MAFELPFDVNRGERLKDFVDYNSEHYFRNLATKLKGADQILLMRPGLAKKHLQEHLTTHQANNLAKKIIGLENFESFEH